MRALDRDALMTLVENGDVVRDVTVEGIDFRIIVQHSSERIGVEERCE